MHVAKTIVCWAALCGDALSWARPLTFPSSPRQLEARELALVLGRQSNSNSSLPALTASITAIQNSVTDTNSSVVPFQGGSIKGLIGLIKINEGVVSLGDNIDNAIKTAQQSPQLNNQDSTTLGVQFLGLQPKITDLLDRLQTKRPEFDKAGFKILDVRSLIRDDLAGQQKQADLLGSSLVKILDPALQPLATPVNQQIQGNFSKAVAAFSGRGGKIKIPAKAVPALSNLLADIGKALGIKASSSNAVAPESNAQAEAPNPAAIVPATDTELSASDPAVAEQSAEQVLAATSDDSLNNLGDDENDLRGIPPLVLSVLRKYGII